MGMFAGGSTINRWRALAAGAKIFNGKSCRWKDRAGQVRKAHFEPIEISHDQTAVGTIPHRYPAAIARWRLVANPSTTTIESQMNRIELRNYLASALIIPRSDPELLKRLRATAQRQCATTEAVTFAPSTRKGRAPTVSKDAMRNTRDDLFKWTRCEDHEVFRAMEAQNGARLYDFLRSAVVAHCRINRPILSDTLIRAFNFQALAFLVDDAGEYRRHDETNIVCGGRQPAEAVLLPELMRTMVQAIDAARDIMDPVALAAFTLWRVYALHPFNDGNKRTASASACFMLCVALGGWLPGTTILPELLRRNEIECFDAIGAVIASGDHGARFDLSRLHALLVRCLEEQLRLNEQK